MGTDPTVVSVVATLDPRVGGPPVVAVADAVALAQQGVACTVVTLDAEPHRVTRHPAARVLADAGVPLVCAAGPAAGRAWRWGVSAALPRVLRPLVAGADVVHAHGVFLFSTAVALGLARRAGAATVVTLHSQLTAPDLAGGTSTLSRRAKGSVAAATVRAVDAFVLSSDLERRASPSAAVQERGHVVYHAVDLPPAPAHRPVGPGPLRLGFLGRLHPVKNVPVLIGALRHLGPGHELVVAGDGPLAPSLRDLAARLGVADRVRWLGFVEPARHAAFFAEIDVLAMPSAFECFGLAAAEAMAHGVPVLVPPSVGVAELVARHGGGAVVAADEHAVADAVRRLATSPAWRAEQGALARRAVAMACSLSEHGTALRHAYDDALSRGRVA